MIIAAAIKIIKDDKEMVFMGKRHHNCLQVMWDAGIRRPFEEVQGFVNHKFEFLDRHEAWKEAEQNAQILPYPPNGTPGPGMLFSEDLW